jgi:transcriptional regulator of met regulon
MFLDYKAFTESELFSRILDCTQKLRATNHVIFLYDSLEAKHRLLSNYINAALPNNEAAIYSASEEAPMAIRAAMKKHGVDCEKYEKSGAL